MVVAVVAAAVAAVAVVAVLVVVLVVVVVVFEGVAWRGRGRSWSPALGRPPSKRLAIALAVPPRTPPSPALPQLY